MDRRWVVRNLIALLFVSCMTGCVRGGSDMGPVGGGLAVIGLGIIVAAFICSVFRNGGDND
jgi:hypothetical protein